MTTTNESSEQAQPVAVAPLSEGLGAWLPIATAPASGLVLLAVEDATGERRTFAAEASFNADGAMIWQITTGWTGWKPMHSAWRAVLWQRLPQAPNVPMSRARDTTAEARHAGTPRLDGRVKPL